MTGSLQIKNDKYYAVLNVTGADGKRKPKWISTGYAVKGNSKRAQQKLRELLDQYEAQEEQHSKDILFTAFAEKWVQSRKNKVDDVTLEGYEEVVRNHIIPYFEPLSLNLSEVTLDHVEEYYEFKSKTGRLDGKPGGLSKRSIRLHHTILGMIFKEGMRKRLIQTNPCSVAELPARSDKSFKGTFLTESQCKKLLEVIENQALHDMVTITLIYGLRRSELMGLKWSAVNFERKTLLISHMVVLKKEVHQKDKTKNSTSNRVYPLVPSVEEIFRRLSHMKKNYAEIFGSAYQDSGYIFTHPDGRPYYPSYPSHELKKVLAKHPELPNIRFHDLRHTCASLLFGLGWSMKDVSEWLGHSTIAITMDTYTHIDAHRKSMLSKGIDKLFCS